MADERVDSKIKHPVRQVLSVIAKIVATGVAGVLLLLVTLVALVVILFFAIPEIRVGAGEARALIAKYAPASVQIEFEDFAFKLSRPKDLPYSKRITLNTSKFCVRYEGEAVNACFDRVNLATTVGWSGPRLPDESKWIPRLASIEPLLITGGVVYVDMTAFPPSDDEPSNFDLVGFVRKNILPKWDLEGSRVEILDFSLKLDAQTTYSAAFDLQPGHAGRALEIDLHDFKASNSPLLVSAVVNVERPASWGAQVKSSDADANVWKVELVADAQIAKGKSVNVTADANITAFDELDFRIRAIAKGIAALQEARLAASLKGPKVNGLASMKMGARTSELRALDFVNCDISANLDQKNGQLRCGPQSVRLALREKAMFKNPELFVFAPQFDLRVNQVTFGKVKGADLEFDLALDHRQLANLKTTIKGSVRSEENKPLQYHVEGNIDLLAPQFSRIVSLLRSTPLSVPAPLNVLEGSVGLQLAINVGDQGGSLDYKLATRLDSRYQAMHLDLDGATNLIPMRKGFHPATDITLSISKLYISAPRFELRVPPAFKTDSRFGAIDDRELVRGEKNEPKMDFKLRVRTLTPGAIRMATNLTRDSIPVSLDVTYDDSKRQDLELKKEDPSGSSVRAASSAPSDGTISGTTSPVRTRDQDGQSKAVAEKAPSPVKGWIVVGRTPINLFKRNAVLEELRLDLFENGDDRLNGRISVTYLEYAINVLIMGQTKDPVVRFSSDPPLEEDQILSVLLFGRPLNELGEDEKSSVATMNAAVTDAVLGISSLYLLASTPIESVGYDPNTNRVTARVGLGGGATVEVGTGSQESGSGIGIRKRLSREFLFRSDVETIGTTGRRTVSALIEWVKRF